MLSSLLVHLLLAAQTPPIAPVPAAVVAPEYVAGVTTSADVIAKLGKPNSVTTITDGSTVLTYISTRTRVKGASFVPIVGLFAGGAKSRIGMKVFTFGPDGRLRAFSSTDSGSECRTGIAGATCH